MARRRLALTRGALLALTALGLSACASKERKDPNDPHGLAGLARVTSGGISVLFPPDAAWGSSYARTTLQILSLGRTVAREYGLKDVPFVGKLTASVQSTTARHAEEEELVDPVTKGYVAFSEVPVDEDFALLFPSSVPLDEALLLAHEQTHGMLNATVSLLHNYSQSWFHESLSELVMVKTALRYGDTARARGLITREIGGLDNVSGELVVDLLRFRCRMKCKFELTAKLENGETRIFDLSDPTDPDRIEASLAEFRALAGGGEIPEVNGMPWPLYDRLLEDWLALVRKPLGEGEFDVSGGRSEVYWLGLALLLELEDSGANLADLVPRLREEKLLRKRVVAPSMSGITGDECIIATNAEFVGVLSSLGHLDITSLARAYPVKRARARLHDLLASVKDP
jgi:hypothetical protein